MSHDSDLCILNRRETNIFTRVVHNQGVGGREREEGAGVEGKSNGSESTTGTGSKPDANEYPLT